MWHGNGIATASQNSKRFGFDYTDGLLMREPGGSRSGSKIHGCLLKLLENCLDSEDIKDKQEPELAVKEVRDELEEAEGKGFVDAEV
ncbi:hypothetical protein Dda_7103 [Drechslerella dactyloides]|uniref:Uncharacterized protein n=1 Tax=Drechslerella dactyloides TaxID=74499 RepID=A0AAD6IUC0_DREDA|nr:hypothetical protein Dda_7103 [Drechslerella dactyloides]